MFTTRTLGQSKTHYENRRIFNRIISFREFFFSGGPNKPRKKKEKVKERKLKWNPACFFQRPRNVLQI